MIISKNELLDVLENAYHTEEQIKCLRKEITDSLKTYAEDNELNLKAIKQAFKLYKDYKSGKISLTDEDYANMLRIIEDHFNDGVLGDKVGV